MDPRSEHLIRQILNPVPMGSVPMPTAAPTFVSARQVVHPLYACGGYTGPERRAQGYLIAEVVEEAPSTRPTSRT